MDVAGSHIVITGAAGGLGAATARMAARRGARLTLTGRNADALGALAAELGADVVLADLCVAADVERLAEVAAGADAVVLNAAVGLDPPLAEVTAGDIDTVIDTNLRAPVHMAVAFARHHLASGASGALVFIGSVAGMATTPATRLYNASKFGLRGFALALRQDLADSAVTVTHVAPGFIGEAGMFVDSGAQLPPGVRTRRPGDVAAAVMRAIERGPAEIVVAPPELRVAAGLAGSAPGLAERVLRRVGAGGRGAAGDGT